MRIDGILYICFLAISFGIGAFAVRRVKTLADYYVAGGSMPWYLLAGSFIAANASAALFLGATNVAGGVGYTFWCGYFTTATGILFAIGVVGVLVRRLSGQYEIYNFADILALRYQSREKTVRIITAVIVPLVYIPYIAAQFIGLAAITAAAFDFNYSVVLVGIILLIVGYTFLGGMVAVVWTDAFQFLVLFLGMVLAVPIGMKLAGNGSAAAGWERIVALGPEIFQWTDASWPWYLVLGQFVWLFAFSAEPHLVTRFLTARDEATILKALPVCLVGVLVLYSSSVPVGLLGRLVAPELASGEYYYIELARAALGTWLGAFALAGVAAAALSTCSTELIVSSQSLSRDLYHRLLAPGAPEKRVLWVARVSVVIMGALTFVLAYFRILSIFWLVILSVSLLTSAFFVPVVGGFFWPRATSAGAIAAMLAGLTAGVSVYIVNQIGGSHYFISELYAGLGASALAFWGVSRFGKPTDAELRVLSSLRVPPPQSGEPS